MNIEGRDAIYNWRSLIATLSVERLNLFLDDIGFPLPDDRLHAVQGVCRAFLRRMVMLEDQQLHVVGGWSDVALTLVEDTTATMQQALGSREAHVFWGWAEDRLLDAPLDNALCAFVDACRLTLDARQDVSQRLLADHATALEVIYMVTQRHAEAVSEMTEWLATLPPSDNDQLAMDVYSPHAYRSPNFAPHSAYAGVARLADHQAMRVMVARLLRLLPGESHEALYQLVATANPRQVLDVAEVRAKLGHVAS